ncbi:Dihydroorotate dehydrogenase (quinone), mitochondrial [Ceratocystis lukuohia]|uniref:Dihydroorotate dehydrogenase (Quinone) mitochondrial n=3 Tax=Ceratocystis TaxID=5157 RepID=A0A0F8B5Z6_CERFI|nr:Dihydroorotate dehydrogenase (quinone) mitochondrial [Ceratocystis platani]PHH51228.1 Dihydroorotate dehydrogenase (quinone), mitochondrial [Ceratocystis fimbriata CBS 114723]
MTPLFAQSRRALPEQLRAASRRYISTASPRTSSGSGFKLTAYTAGLAIIGSAAYIYGTDSRASVHRYVVPPLLRTIFPDAEDAHHVSTALLESLYSAGLHPRERTPENPALATSVFGNPLSNPIGISAGLDKHADIPDVLFDLGAGIVEVGGCTPLAQPGNDRPRLFRVPVLEGLVNRYGLNSHGADAMARKLRERVLRYAISHGVSEEDVLNGAVAVNGADAPVPPGSLRAGKLLLVQVAKNKATDQTDVEAVARDYVYCVKRLAPYADVLVVNVSSPNTPGLRDLQAVEPLTRLLSAVVEEANKTQRRTRPRVMVKVSPDEDEAAQMGGIVQAVMASGVDGVIVGNTTSRRAGLVAQSVPLTGREQRALQETGGYSGPEMFPRTLDLVSRYRKMFDEQMVGSNKDRMTLFATGGITNGKQALETLQAGASAAMVYTTMVYNGAGTVTRIKDEMAKEIA